MLQWAATQSRLVEVQSEIPIADSALEQTRIFRWAAAQSHLVEVKPAFPTAVGILTADLSLQYQSPMPPCCGDLLEVAHRSPYFGDLPEVARGRPYCAVLPEVAR